MKRRHQPQAVRAPRPMTGRPPLALLHLALLAGTLLLSTMVATAATALATETRADGWAAEPNDTRGAAEQVGAGR